MVRISMRSDDVTTTFMVESPNYITLLSSIVLLLLAFSSTCLQMLASHVKHEDWHQGWKIFYVHCFGNVMYGNVMYGNVMYGNIMYGRVMYGNVV